MKQNLSLLLLLGFFACAWAYPNPESLSLAAVDQVDLNELENSFVKSQMEWQPNEQELLLLEEQEEAEPEQLVRLRRQLNVQGGGSPRQGFDLSINGRAPVWQSPNGRHSLDATGQYSQHLGGPYGNSRPNWGAGAMYTFRF
ncbi:uncharacterized protein LOC6578968 [Drosophila mojavensis]|uniref:Attacin C-terminal domain-containing protein n=1 Tax=Drosophila mojavensis TaxID=7230 RepID=B4KMQ8_DROMO|nr:uncharacterized protein LOC6578968 [Drosophila mojavensis]EDW08800.1 uncharacterized protein Dmoj_GI19362 [Drosophila mojavensis]